MADLNASGGSVKLVLEIKKAKEIYYGDVSDYQLCCPLVSGENQPSFGRKMSTTTSILPVHSGSKAAPTHTHIILCRVVNYSSNQTL